MILMNLSVKGNVRVGLVEVGMCVSHEWVRVRDMEVKNGCWVPVCRLQEDSVYECLEMNV